MQRTSEWQLEWDQRTPEWQKMLRGKGKDHVVDVFSKRKDISQKLKLIS